MQGSGFLPVFSGSDGSVQSVLPTLITQTYIDISKLHIDLLLFYTLFRINAIFLTVTACLQYFSQLRLICGPDLVIQFCFLYLQSLHQWYLLCLRQTHFTAETIDQNSCIFFPFFHISSDLFLSLIRIVKEVLHFYFYRFQTLRFFPFSKCIFCNYI